jgi:hypothetical protein
MVREPRAVLSEFGLTLDDETTVTVWDSSSEVRYMVLPQRPPETDNTSETELVDIISRDAMIVVALYDDGNGFDWREFQQRLINEVDTADSDMDALENAYYEQWLTTFSYHSGRFQDVLAIGVLIHCNTIDPNEVLG